MGAEAETMTVEMAGLTMFAHCVCVTSQRGESKQKER